MVWQILVILSQYNAPQLTRKTIEGRRVVDQESLPERLIGRPLGGQVEEQGVVGLLVPLRRVGPIASPDHPLRRRLKISAGDLGLVRVCRRADLGVLVDARELDPGFPLVDQPADDPEGGVIEALRLRKTAHMVEDDRRDDAHEQRLVFRDLVPRQMELDMPAEVVDAPGQGFDHVEAGHRRGRDRRG